MAFVAIANCCAIELRMLWNSQRVALTFGFYKSGGYDSSDLITISDAMGLWWYTYARTYQMAYANMREVYARSLDSESAPSYSNTTYVGVTGTMGGSTTSPNNVCFCLSFRTGLRGRANRGRNYWFGFGPSQVTNQNYITSAYRANLIALYNRLLPGGGSIPSGHVWVVLSRQLNHVIQGRHIPITSVLAVDDTLDSQRKRLPGRGL
jgi:hypothetical protein